MKVEARHQCKRWRPCRSSTSAGSMPIFTRSFSLQADPKSQQDSQFLPSCSMMKGRCWSRRTWSGCYLVAPTSRRSYYTEDL